MDRIATVRVRLPDGASGGRPSRDTLEEAARLLAEHGFSIHRIGRFGISLQGDDALFSSVLGVESPQDNAVQPVRPASSGLAALVDLVEMPTTPTSF